MNREHSGYLNSTLLGVMLEIYDTRDPTCSQLHLFKKVGMLKSRVSEPREFNLYKPNLGGIKEWWFKLLGSVPGKFKLSVCLGEKLITTAG